MGVGEDLNVLASAGRLAAARQATLRRLVPYALIIPSLCFLVLFFFAPSVYNIRLSLLDISLLELGRGGRFAGVRNYLRLLRDPQVHLAFRNTVLWLTAATVLIRLFLGLGLALLLNGSALRRWRLAGAARTMLLIPWATPPVVAVAAWRWLLDAQYGAVNIFLVNLGLIREPVAFFARTETVWWSVVTIIVWRELPFVTLTLLAGLQSIPEELYEAAHVDGAGGAQAFWHVTIPLLRPVLAVVALLTTIWTFNNFVYVWLSTQGGPGNYTSVLATAVYLEGFSNYQMGYSAAIGMTMTIILVIFALAYFRTIFRRSVAQA